MMKEITGSTPNPAVNKHQGALSFVSQNRILAKSEQLLKNGIWIYFFLLVMEGGLRKWVLPGLATPVLIIRDPLALWIIYTASRANILKPNNYINTMILITVLGIITAMTVGHGNLLVTIYGARVLILHFPIMFIMGRVLDRDDVIKICKAILWISIPMTLLLALQFFSSQAAFVNRVVGGESETYGFQGAQGYFRPSGTFSFTSGVSQYYSLVTAVIFYFWLNPKTINRYLLQTATGCLLLAIPLSISRGLTFQVILTGMFTIFAISGQPKLIGRIVLAMIIVAMLILVLSTTSYFNIAFGALSERFMNASASEGGVVSGTIFERYIKGSLISLVGISNQPFFGHGLGMGTNVGAKILTGNLGFLIAEGEWGRLIGELGSVMGLTVIFTRISLCIKLLRLGFQRVKKRDILAWLLMSFGIITIAQSSWSQPTSLGFSTLLGGLIIASLKTPKTSTE